MKILLCADIHDYELSLALLREKSKEVDFIICAGDMSLWGNGLSNTLKEMDSWGKKVFIIHGNHEDEEDTRVICNNFENIVFFHKEVVQHEDLTLIGWGGGGFSLQDKGFERFISKIKLDDFSRSILVTHAPPFETCLDEVQEGVFVGCESIKQFILKKKCLLAISGHIHETSGVVCELENTVLINPGAQGVIVEL